LFHTKQQYCGYRKSVFNFGLVAMINESLELGIRKVGMAPVRKPSASSGDIKVNNYKCVDGAKL
jgi:hypothetical protein